MIEKQLNDQILVALIHPMLGKMFDQNQTFFSLHDIAAPTNVSQCRTTMFAAEFVIGTGLLRIKKQMLFQVEVITK